MTFLKSHHLHFLGDPHQEHFDHDEFHPGWGQNDQSNFKDILQIYWDWIGNGVLITEGAMIISNSDG